MKMTKMSQPSNNTTWVLLNATGQRPFTPCKKFMHMKNSTCELRYVQKKKEKEENKVPVYWERWVSGALLKNVLLVGMQVGGGDRSDREEVEKPCTSGELWGEGG